MYKKTVIATILSCSLTAALLWPYFSASPSLPMPTNGTMVHDGEEDTGRTDEREKWLESLHWAAPGTNWREIEHQNRLQQQARISPQQRTAACGIQPVAEGLLQGKWEERGSLNQAGSVFDTEFDPSTDDIWLISAGGTLWKGHRFQQQWEVVNQTLQFTPGLLRFIPTSEGRRMVAFAHRLPHYSDDDGFTWQAATGIAHDDRWGNISDPTVANDSLSTVFVLSKPSYWEPMKLYRSINKGEQYQSIWSFDTHEFNRIAINQPHNASTVLLVEKGEEGFAQFYQPDPVTGDIEPVNDTLNLNFGGARANVVGSLQEETLLLYTYVEAEDGVWKVMRSVNGGLDWEHRGELPVRPWSVGLYVSPSNPDFLLMGAVECFYSLDGGMNWEKTNNWYDYYDDVPGSLHADMMHFSEFETAAGQPFTLVSNHGGLSVSYDQMETTENIALSGLNVSQYYSVRTDPHNSNVVYAGSQDQGFQRSALFEENGAQDFEQVISGDYGHIAFSNEGQYLWTVYPGGWVTLYTQPTQSYLTASYELESELESVWLPPLASGPVEEGRGIYMAGGNIDGGPGSYLIHLDWADNEIVATQGTFDFADASGDDAALSAIAASRTNPDHWYAATTNGRFFYSRDNRQNWEQTVNFIPGGHYLYGQAIWVSAKDSLRVVLAGSGYSNPPVYLSTDGGENFASMSEGLPNTMVFDLAANEAETLIFAATEAGPYVYIQETGRWYNIAGPCAPLQTYWSVEYLEETGIARFGTYGRGIWDYQIDMNVQTAQATIPAQQFPIWPNPSTGQAWITLPVDQSWTVHIFNSNGQLAQQYPRLSGEVQLDLGHLPKGAYFIRIAGGKGQISKAQRLLLF